MREMVFDRHGEADPGPGAAARKNHGVHADQASRRVEQRAAGVARIDRRIGLDHVADAHAAGALHFAAERADDAGGHGVVEAEGIANRDHLLADFELLRLVRQLHGNQQVRRSLDPKHRNVLARLDPHDAGREGTLVVQ